MKYSQEAACLTSLQLKEELIIQKTSLSLHYFEYMEVILHFPAGPWGCGNFFYVDKGSSGNGRSLKLFWDETVICRPNGFHTHWPPIMLSWTLWGHLLWSRVNPTWLSLSIKMHSCPGRNLSTNASFSVCRGPWDPWQDRWMIYMEVPEPQESIPSEATDNPNPSGAVLKSVVPATSPGTLTFREGEP